MFQEVEAPRCRVSLHMKVVKLSALCTCHLYPPGNIPSTVMPRLVSDPANEFFGQRFFSLFFVFWTRLTNMDSANECFSGCAR